MHIILKNNNFERNILSKLLKIIKKGDKMSDKRCCSMLLQFKFKNYKCFYDETILDLTATGEKRHINTTIDIN